MSVEAISWALNLAPVPADRGGQPSSAYKFVLVGLANHAGPDGTGAFPSVATLVRYTGLAERTVRTCLDRLAAEGIIAPCDPGIVAARIKRADRRPQGWDLNLSLVRNDLDDAAVAVLEHQFPGLGVRPAAAAQPSADGRSGGVQPAQLRGAAVAPEPSKEPSWEPPPKRPRARFRPQPVLAAAVGWSVSSSPPWDCDWRLTAAQRARLAPAVATALTSGWTPQRLAGFTGGNITGVRNSYAVLAARLSPAELPAPPARPARPPWCGECDQATRMLGFDGDAPRPCPRCKPAAINSRASPLRRLV